MEVQLCAFEAGDGTILLCLDIELVRVIEDSIASKMHSGCHVHCYLCEPILQW